MTKEFDRFRNIFPKEVGFKTGFESVVRRDGSRKRKQRISNNGDQRKSVRQMFLVRQTGGQHQLTTETNSCDKESVAQTVMSGKRQ